MLNALTPQASYDFLTNQLDIKLVGSRTNEDGTVQSDIALAPLALGALTDGVTVREMAGGYSTFINDGVFGGTRTYTKVLDNEGNTVLENTPHTDKGFTNVHTVYDMLDCLQNVTAHGTAYGIQIDGVETAGKTGTTSSNTDIWFCGVTPEYSAAVWVGYEHNYRLDGLYGRNAAEIWLKVMEKVHADDSGLVFDSHPQDFVEETYCMDTGLLASGACREAGRAATGRFWKDKFRRRPAAMKTLRRSTTSRRAAWMTTTTSMTTRKATTARTPTAAPTRPITATAVMKRRQRRQQRR